jgi:hypothetical protein
MKKIDKNQFDKIDDSAIECINGSILNHVPNEFFNTKNDEEAKKVKEFMESVYKRMQNCPRIAELQAVTRTVPIPVGKPSKDLFVPESVLAKYGLTMDEEKDQGRIYTGKPEKDKIQRFVDIRWVFKSPEDARKFHLVNLDNNSEDGKPYPFNIEIEGINDLKIYMEGEKTKAKFKEMQLDARQYFILFTKGNVAYKLFFGVSKKYDLNDLIPIVEAARDQNK